MAEFWIGFWLGGALGGILIGAILGRETKHETRKPTIVDGEGYDGWYDRWKAKEEVWKKASQVKKARVKKKSR